MVAHKKLDECVQQTSFYEVEVWVAKGGGYDLERDNALVVELGNSRGFGPQALSRGQTVTRDSTIS